MSTGTPSHRRPYGDLNARLKALIPSAPVTYSQKRVSPGASAVRESEPTPPPEVLARTKYIYRSGSLSAQGGNKLFGGQFKSERFVMAYVTALEGSTCTGWLIRYPRTPDRYGAAPGPFRPGSINYPGPQGENGFRPIVEPDVSFRCDPKGLTPFSGASSDRSVNP
ncbi:MAG: hypothetical protein GIW98_05990 [Candidatus Eremiobacteraeota bacterium]|nr:hypothetical protein [Candidatus Eremiobacteraeota bacterium]